MASSRAQELQRRELLPGRDLEQLLNTVALLVGGCFGQGSRPSAGGRSSSKKPGRPTPDQPAWRVTPVLLARLLVH